MRCPSPSCRTRRLPAVAALVIALSASWAGPMAVPAAASPGAAPGASPVSRVDVALAVRLGAAVNTVRQQAGRGPVVIDADRLASVASTRALDMVRTRTIAPETTAAGHSVTGLLKAQGVRWTAGGEAIAWGSGKTGEDPLNGILVRLLSNPANRALLLAGNATHLGVGVGILDDGGSIRLPGTGAEVVPAAPRFAIASVILIEKDGPASPRLAVRPVTLTTGMAMTITVTPDGTGRLGVVITNDVGDLLEVIAWDRLIRGPTTIRWNGRINGRPARAGTYQVRAFTVDRSDRASDPARLEIAITR